MATRRTSAGALLLAAAVVLGGCAAMHRREARDTERLLEERQVADDRLEASQTGVYGGGRPGRFTVE